MQFIRKYGTAAKIRIPVVKADSTDFAVSADWTPAAGDVKVSKDGGGAANITSLPTAIAMGNGAVWEFSLSATEMQAAEITVTVVDAATKAVQDQALSVITFGNASAALAIDWSDAVRMGLTALPNAVAEAAGGLFTRGTGAGQINQEDNGFISVNLKAILRTTLTETSGQIAAAFKKLFDVASPVFTATSVNQTGDNYARLGAPAGASVSADIATVASYVDTEVAAIKTKTDQLVFTVANQVDVNVVDWKGATAPAMTGDAYARIGAPAGASVSADIAAAKSDTAAIKAKTDNLPASPAAVSDIPTAAAVRSEMDANSTKLAHLDVDMSSRLAGASYTAPDNADIAAIKAKTDGLTFTVAGQLDANIQYVNDVQVTGDGHTGTEWGPA